MSTTVEPVLRTRSNSLMAGQRVHREALRPRRTALLDNRHNSLAQILSIYPGSFRGFAELSDHEPDGGPVQESAGLSPVAFPILGEAPAVVQPGEGPFDDPAFDSTVERGSFGPVRWSATDVRCRHLATVFWLIP